MKNKKKIIVLSCMIALLVATAVFNFVMTGTTTAQTSNVTYSSDDYFENYRLERQNSRNEELLQLDSVISSANLESEEYKTALTMKTELTAMTEKEMMLENLIKAYGFKDVVVVMGMDSGNVNVITKSEELSSDDAILIFSIISEEKIAMPENIKIIPIS